MNKVLVSGRLTKDPEIFYPNKSGVSAVAKYTLAVNRYVQHKEETSFLSCVAFDKFAEFAEKYFHKGMKLEVTGRLRTGSYVNHEGRTIYTTDIIVESQEFAEKKSEISTSANQNCSISTDEGGFMNIPDGIDEELPFS